MSTSGNIIPGYTIGKYNIRPKGDNIIERVDLEYTKGGSDKVYILILSQSSATKVLYVEAFYGRRYSSCTPHSIIETMVESSARKAFTTTQVSKEKKGYTVVGTQVVRAPMAAGNNVLYQERILWPMSAQPLKEGKKKDDIIASDEWIAEEKDDGVRLTVHVTPNGLRMFSRSAGKNDPTKPLEKTHAFDFLKNVVFPEKYVGTILDCEAMADNMDSATISGHINATDGRDTSFLYFKVFDLLQEGTVDIAPLEWKFRRMKLTQLMNELAIVFAQSSITQSKAAGGKTYPIVDANDLFNNGLFRMTKYTIRNKVEFHDEILLAGGEGTMWKNIRAKYVEGGRPANNWYKWKKQDTADVVIVGFTNGQGKYAGQIGAVRYAEFLTEKEIDELGIKKSHSQYMYYNSEDHYLVEIGQCSGMTDEQRLEFANNQGTYLNKVMEVEFMERTAKGALRHPRFLRLRDDKVARDCIYANQK